MTPPPYEVADVIRAAGSEFLKRMRKSASWARLKVLYAILRCRTAALGGHRDRCSRCGYQTISFHSCRNRHCPKCQVNARTKWLRKRQQELQLSLEDDGKYSGKITPGSYAQDISFPFTLHSAVRPQLTDLAKKGSAGKDLSRWVCSNRGWR